MKALKSRGTAKTMPLPGWRSTRAAGLPSRRRLRLMALLHLHLYGPDTPSLMARRLLGRRTRIDPTALEEALEQLAAEGLVERLESRIVPKSTATSSIKPWIKVRAGSREVRRHGQYYSLTREGRRSARRLRELVRELTGLVDAAGVDDYTLLSLEPIHLYILLHLRMAGIDYAKSIARLPKISIEDTLAALDELEALGLIERVHGSAIKRTQAKLKLSYEVRKHHTYYQLSRSGEALVKAMRRGRDFLKKIMELMTGHEKAYRLTMLLREAGYEHPVTLARLLPATLEETQSLLEELVSLGLVVETKPKTLKMKHRRAKPKKETRCLHKYYRLSRLAELLLRQAT